MKDNTLLAIIVISIYALGSICVYTEGKDQIIIGNSAQLDSLTNEVLDLKSRVKYLEFRCDSIIK